MQSKTAPSPRPRSSSFTISITPRWSRRGDATCSGADRSASRPGEIEIVGVLVIGIGELRIGVAADVQPPRDQTHSHARGALEKVGGGGVPIQVAIGAQAGGEQLPDRAA